MHMLQLPRLPRALLSRPACAELLRCPQPAAPALLSPSHTGMMSMAAAEQQKKEEASAPAAAHSPLEPVVISRGFAASIFKH